MFIPVSKLLTSDRTSETPTTQIAGGVKTFGNFKGEIAAMQTRLEARQATQVVLATTSSYAFAVGMLAAMQAHCRIIVPPNALPGMLAHFVGADCPLLSDIDGAGGANQILI